MTIEPATELGSGCVLRLPRARVVPLSAPPAAYTAAVERYLTGAGIAKSSARIYRISLTTWGWMLAGEPAPPDRTRGLTENQIAALWRLDVALREKTQRKMLYESAARADEVLFEELELVEEHGADLDVAALRAALEEVAPRAAVMTAAATVVSLVPEDEGSAEVAMRAALATRYATVRPFLSLLGESEGAGRGERGQAGPGWGPGPSSAGAAEGGCQAGDGGDRQRLVLRCQAAWYV
ncbi:hypothetical protein ACFV0L_30230 [Streptosporangium canum]|uniref:hypothetical protein n=1 Tax=Streptosporangium canum TaxID=324952 RepID=UPI0036AF79C5